MPESPPVGHDGSNGGLGSLRRAIATDHTIFFFDLPPVSSFFVANRSESSATKKRRDESVKQMKRRYKSATVRVLAFFVTASFVSPPSVRADGLIDRIRQHFHGESEPYHYKKPRPGPPPRYFGNPPSHGTPLPPGLSPPRPTNPGNSVPFYGAPVQPSPAPVYVPLPGTTRNLNPGSSRLPSGRTYYQGRYYGNFNNRFFGPQYGYF